MKKLLTVFVFVALGMIAQGFVDHRVAHKKSIAIARNSFETGCLMEGKADCYDAITGVTDTDIIVRGYCFNLVISECALKTKNYEEWFAGGAK